MNSTELQELGKDWKGIKLRFEYRAVVWWSRQDSNLRPSHCERDALPTELRPHKNHARVNAANSETMVESCAATQAERWVLFMFPKLGRGRRRQNSAGQRIGFTNITNCQRESVESRTAPRPGPVASQARLQMVSREWFVASRPAVPFLRGGGRPSDRVGVGGRSADCHL